jgi:hypothetical protein
MGAIHEVGFTERAAAVADVYAQAQALPNVRGQQRSVLVVCATHDEIDRVTEAIRSGRKQTGALGPGVAVHRHVPLNWTEAQKRSCRNYRPGQWLEFHRAAKDVGRNEALEVVRVDRKRIIARNEQGVERILTSKQSQCFSVYERQALDVAAGDRLLLTANRREAGFRATNGEIVTVRHVDAQGRIELEDGRVLPSNYRQIEHGYAVTAHRSQGKTVDAVVISAEVMNKELFYVSASRGRESVAVVTSDVELLRNSVARSGARLSAMELARRTEASRPKPPRRRAAIVRGEQRGVKAGQQQARQMAIWNRMGSGLAHQTAFVDPNQLMQKERAHDRQVERGR